MKQTILFSNVKGDITADLCECKFYPNLAKILKSSIKKNSNLVFINAPGFQNENLYLKRILNCFDSIDVVFDNIIELRDKNKHVEFKSFPEKNRVYFLMGGNPITQLDIIKEYNLLDTLKNCDDLVIGFCAGAINLSKHSIITSDDDFDTPFSYDGVKRIDLVIEPHFKIDKSKFTKNRIAELTTFTHQLNCDIVALPDSSCIHITGDKTTYYGKVYTFKKENH